MPPATATDAFGKIANLRCTLAELDDNARFVARASCPGGGIGVSPMLAAWRAVHGQDARATWRAVQILSCARERDAEDRALNRAAAVD